MGQRLYLILYITLLHCINCLTVYFLISIWKNIMFYQLCPIIICTSIYKYHILNKPINMGQRLYLILYITLLHCINCLTVYFLISIWKNIMFYQLCPIIICTSIYKYHILNKPINMGQRLYLILYITLLHCINCLTVYFLISIWKNIMFYQLCPIIICTSIYKYHILNKPINMGQRLYLILYITLLHCINCLTVYFLISIWKNIMFYQLCPIIICTSIYKYHILNKPINMGQRLYLILYITLLHCINCLTVYFLISIWKNIMFYQLCPIIICTPIYKVHILSEPIIMRQMQYLIFNISSLHRLDWLFLNLYLREYKILLPLSHNQWYIYIQIHTQNVAIIMGKR